MADADLFPCNFQAFELHEQGLAYATGDGPEGQNFAAAHQAFGEARLVLSVLEPTPGVQLQAARIQRDQGFTMVREDRFDEAEGELLESRRAIVGLLGRLGLAQPLPRGTTEAGWQAHLVGEYIATMGCLRRMVVRRQIADGRINPDKRPGWLERHALALEQRDYDARALAGLSDNRYYEVSDAMRGLLEERLLGRPAHMVPWLVAAASGLYRGLVEVTHNGELDLEVALMVQTRNDLKQREPGAGLARQVRVALTETAFATNGFRGVQTAGRIGQALVRRRTAYAVAVARP